jgi:AcrR family transcriptional regulator/2-hydroxychromene-2-carboxylate isomerase
MTKAVTSTLDGGRPVGKNGASMPPELTEALPLRLEPTYEKLQPRWCGLSKDQVAADQRRRLHEAMVEISASRGYQATTITALWARAGVSSHTYYALFPKREGDPKEACFLGAYDYVVGRAVERINLAYRGEEDPERRLCRAFEQFASEAATEPQAARFALLEPFGAGQAAFARMDRGREMFEGLIAASISNPSRGSTLSPTIAKGLVGGIERVSRVYLVAGKIDELAATANELSAWVSTYRPWSRSTRAQTPEPVNRLQAGLSAKDGRLRVLRAAAVIAASDGYSGLSQARIIRLADVSEKIFASLYSGADAIERCFLAAVDLLSVEALVCAANASRHAQDWPDAVRSAIVALLEHVAAHPFLGPVAFIEIFSVGPSGIERRSMLLQRFRDQLVNGVPESHRPSELIAEAIVGAIWAVVHDFVVRGQSNRVAELADDATYLALAPLIGHESAIQLILGEHRRTRSSGRSPSVSSTPRAHTDARSRPAQPIWSSDPDVPLVVIDLASVETYVLVRPLSDLAVEREGAVWCPLTSKPAGLDLDVETARRHVERLQLPFVRPERHPAPLPRAMRLATFASARGSGAIFTIRATRLAWAAGADLDCLGDQPSLDDGEVEDDLDDYLRLIAREIGLDIEEAKLAMEDGSDWDRQLDQAADCLAQLGIDSAPALRWQGHIYAGLDAISAFLADREKPPPHA